MQKQNNEIIKSKIGSQPLVMNPPNSTIVCGNLSTSTVSPGTNNAIKIIIQEDDVVSHGDGTSSNEGGCISGGMSIPLAGSNSACPNTDIAKIVEEDEDQMLSTKNLEKEDKKRILAARSRFYSLNEKFEQLLQFKPIRKLTMWQVEIDLTAAYQVFSAFSVQERVESLAT